MNCFSLTLWIDYQSYTVTRLPVGANHVRGYRLTRDNGKGHYDCSQHQRGWCECSCPDFLYRHQDGSLCKHLRGLLEMGLLCDLEMECYHRWAESRQHLATLLDAGRAALRAGLYQCEGCQDGTCPACQLDRAIAFESPTPAPTHQPAACYQFPEKCPF